VEVLCAGWGCGDVGVLLLGGFSCKVFSSVSPIFYFRKHAFCFLPLVPLLESPTLVMCLLLKLVRKRNPEYGRKEKNTKESVFFSLTT
jgi:hypothetical protein